jgi:hypothetical protein
VTSHWAPSLKCSTTSPYHGYGDQVFKTWHLENISEANYERERERDNDKVGVTRAWEMWFLYQTPLFSLHCLSFSLPLCIPVFPQSF